MVAQCTVWPAVPQEQYLGNTCVCVITELEKRTVGIVDASKIAQIALSVHEKPERYPAQDAQQLQVGTQQSPKDSMVVQACYRQGQACPGVIWQGNLKMYMKAQLCLLLCQDLD